MLLDVNVTSNIPKKLPANMAKVRQRLRIAMKKTLQVIQRDARRVHRFKAASGHLDKSISTKASNDGQKGSIFIDDSIAPYGNYVHDGQRTWKPDQFVYKSAKRHSDLIVKNILKIFKEVI